METLESLRYPVGKFNMQANITQEMVKGYMNTLSKLPGQMAEVWNSLSVTQRNMPYREGGWTISQVVHHVADSHMNAYIRTKMAVTEDHPTIKPYKEELWAQLPDMSHCSPDVSLQLITAMHRRWVSLLENLNESDFSRTYYHPENKREYTVNELLCLYDWHSRHHLAHMKLVMGK